MDAILQALSASSTVRRGLTLLLDASAKGAVLLVLAGVAALAMRKASAAARHLVWSLAVVSLLVLPVLPAALPAWHLPFLPTFQADEPAAQPDPTPLAPVAQAPAHPARVPLGREPFDEASGEAREPVVPVQVPVAAATAEASLSPEPKARCVPWMGMASIVWGAGALGILGLVLLSALSARRFVKQAQPLPPESRWGRALAELVGSGQVPPRAQVLTSGGASIPITCGCVGPAVVVPSDTDGWPDDRIKAVLLHELAHVRRHDCMTQTLSLLAAALHWFNPLV